LETGGVAVALLDPNLAGFFLSTRARGVTAATAVVEALLVFAFPSNR